MSYPARSDLPAIDAIKALASQVIVLHHLALYGPLSETVASAFPSPMQMLREFGMLVVPAFLVIGGFLSARSLLPRLGDLNPRQLPKLAWSRYQRLARPYVVALLAAIVCAWLARLALPHPDTPAVPELLQLLSHLLLLQDVAGQEALSTGVWYVAIDFQLYLLFLVLVAATWPLRGLARLPHAQLVFGVSVWLALLSLFWFNRYDELDIWAPYFFGAYGLGIIAERLTAQHGRLVPLAILVAITASALLVEWRIRLLIAGITAVALVVSQHGHARPSLWDSPLIRYLGRISYSLFLIHYPVSLLVGAFVARLWPGNLVASSLGLFFTWASSMVAATLLHALVEQRRTIFRLPRPTFAR